MEDTEYPVGLRQQGRVDESEAKASADSLHSTHHRARLSEEHKGDEVADQEATQKEVAQLTSRCLQDNTISVGPSGILFSEIAVATVICKLN